MLRRLFQTLGLVGISVLLCAGDWYSVQVTTSDQSGLNARFAFDLTNTNDTLNCVYLTDLDSDAKIQDVYTIGGGHDDWELFHFGFLFDASVGLCDSAGGFFNGIVVDVDSLGTYMSFGAEFDPVYTNVPGARDRFAFYFLGAFDHVLATDDTLASALFTLTLNDDGSQDLTVFYPMTFTAPDELTLDLGDLTGTPREEGPPRILQAGPNPFQRGATVEFSLEATSRVGIRIYDVKGGLCQVLLDEQRPAGVGSVYWDGSNQSGRQVGSGVYFIELRSQAGTVIRKLVKVRS